VKNILSVLMMLLLASQSSAVGLNESLEQEARILVAEIQELNYARTQLKINHTKEMTLLSKEYLASQAELISAQGQNQKLSDQYQTLKSELSNQMKIEERVESSWERIYKVMLDKNDFYELHDGLSDRVGWLAFKDGKEFVDLRKKREVLAKAFGLLAQSQVNEERTVNFLSGDVLNSGQILRVGFLGAQLKDTKLPLAPMSDGVLVQQFERTQVGSQGVFIFNDLKKSSLKVDAGLWDRLVSFLPALFLAGLFVIVLGLFGLFVRE